MKISSPPGLHYPITVLELLKKADDNVRRSERLFTYTYESTVTETNRYGEEQKLRKKLTTHFAASTDGTIARWHIRPGAVVARPGTDMLEIEEPCTHEIQFGGLCAECGQDMTKIDHLTQLRNTDRATVNMTHDNVALLVSHNEALRGEEETKKRLLDAKKLTLIVDLDQTVIHTTCERTIAEWKADPENPNHDAVKDVEGFQLADDNVANVAANWYYVKKRPGLQDFFDRVSTKYEMHVYTMATRAYAQAVCKIIDPERKYFGDRILSRDENYTDKLKSLQRLFYHNTSMVVIIDDRADVWQYSPHLVRVPVFNFFPGAGDINASFLPKQQELVTQSKPLAPPPKKTEEALTVTPNDDKPAPTPPVEGANGVGDALEQQLLSMASPETLDEQTKEQERVIIAQQTERPLLQQQLMQDKADEEAEAEASEESDVANGEAQHSEVPKHRHSILHNDDRGLDVIENNLNRVHSAFYDEYRTLKAVGPAGRVAALKGERSPKKRPTDSIPDVAELMPAMKEQVLAGTVVVFSGIIPLGVDVQTTDYALWIKSFGAEVSTSVNRRTTHVIANPDLKTTKVKKAARYDSIKIVNPEWMFQCCSRWEHVDETPYIIPVDRAERGGSPIEDDNSINASGEDEADGLAESPVTLNLTADNWDSMDNEFGEFMNSDDTDGEHASESDSERSDDSTASTSSQTQKKRKRTNGNTTDGSEAEESDSSVVSTSRLQRRKKRTMERVTSLTNVVTAEKSSGLPTPEATGTESLPGAGSKDGPEENGVAPDLQEDNDDALEAELLAGFDSSDGEA
ncbi:fcp1-like phosphatase [Stagonosporopsis vannaccii]|nr:fcp1-like phosphatase [Stagonosporopsis vannaccii]